MIPSSFDGTTNRVNGNVNYPNSSTSSSTANKSRNLDEVRQQIKSGTFSVNVERLASKIIQSGVLEK